MKKISFWASTHTQTARILIVIIKLLLALLAYHTGMGLYKANLILPANEIYFASLLVLIIIIIIYPDRRFKTTSIKRFYLKQKLCDFILPLCSFAVIAVMVNNADITSPNAYAYGHSSIKNPTAKEILASGKTKESLTRKEKKILKKEFYIQLKKFTAAKLSNDQFRSGESWKIILAIVVMLGLLSLLASLVCSLSCSGSDAAAGIVGILGLVGIIWAFTAVIKRIKRGPKITKDDKDG